MKTIVCGMSGGVDSSVAALLLKKQGYNVLGVFMKNWEETTEDGFCSAEDDYFDVKSVCNKIGIPYYTVNYSKQYLDRVFEDFLEEYRKGRTPNPDVLCNKEIKFGPFLDFANKIGADNIATGHYAGVEEKDGLYYLKKSKDLNKDQSYFLNQLSQAQLSKVLFPLEEIDKPEVRKIAEEYGFSNAKKKDSTGICFIGERKFREFLKNYLPIQSGKIVTPDGKVVGEHIGLSYYTLGQRKGLNIGGRSDGNGNRWYVVDKRLTTNELVVTQGEGEELLTSSLKTYKVNWIPKKPEKNEFECLAKFRYRQPDQAVRVILNGEGADVYFKEKQRAITPGQYVVFYNAQGYCLGGGVIEETFK